MHTFKASLKSINAQIKFILARWRSYNTTSL